MFQTVAGLSQPNLPICYVSHSGMWEGYCSYPKFEFKVRIKLREHIGFGLSIHVSVLSRYHLESSCKASMASSLVTVLQTSGWTM